MTDNTIRIEGTETGPETYRVVAIPKHAKPFTFYVKPRSYRTATGRFCHGYVVSASGDKNAPGYFTHHRSFSAAVRSANYRARRYVRAYRINRNMVAAKVVAA